MGVRRAEVHAPTVSRTGRPHTGDQLPEVRSPGVADSVTADCAADCTADAASLALSAMAEAVSDGRDLATPQR